jgi:hypothetical protein
MRYKRSGTAQNLIPEFVRIVREAQPTWVVMENVRGAITEPSIPRDWHRSLLRDYDCGGLTTRVRAIWTSPMMLMLPGIRGGTAKSGNIAYSVCASEWRVRDTATARYSALTLCEAARLQGEPELGRGLYETWGRSSPALSAKYRNRLGVHLVGNGVPRAMGDWIAARGQRRTEGDGRLDRRADSQMGRWAWRAWRRGVR